MKNFKFLKEEQSHGIPVNELNNIPLPEWITETSHRILYLQGYWQASIGDPRLNEFRRGLSELGMDIYDAGWYEFYANRRIVPNENI